LSDGRLDVGIGHGFVKWESLTFGIPLQELRERFQENLAIILSAWRAGEFSHEGSFHRYNSVKVLPRAVQRPRQPIWMGATSTPESSRLPAAADSI
jgi:alkanesulfonate monooxygenase SsuD/methylene tetrahydromethanopterin reductase-like flavin-dependent oxidoreductase (luciferase family)